MPEYFFDYVGGLSTNSGLTEALPKKTDQDIVGLILAGNTLRLKRGVIWPRSGNYGDVVLDTSANLASVCTIKDYGVAVNPPILDNLTYDNVATGWTHIGTGAPGRWSKATGAGVSHTRVMIGGSAAALTIGGLAWRGSADVNATYPFWWSADVLYIYTGSTTVSPPVFYSGLAYVASNSTTGFRMRGAKNLLIQNIRSIGAHLGGWVFEGLTVDNTDIQLDDCEALYTGLNSGFRIRSFSGVLANRRITLNRPVYDLKTNASENEATSGRVGGSDAINITLNYDQITVTDPTLTRARHAAINCYDQATYTPGIVKITAGKNYGVCDLSLIEYGRGLGIAGSNAALDVTISGLKFDGQITRSQLGGKVKVSGCSWKNLRYGLNDVSSGFESSQAVLFQEWDASPGDNRMLDVVFQNNLIEHPRSSAIVFRKGVNVVNTDKIRVYNNTIVDVTYYGENAHKAFDTQEGGFGAPDFQLVKNNNVITPSAGGTHVRWNGVATTVNATTGFTSNVENVEGYSNRTAGDYTILRSGACYRAGAVGVLGLLDLEGLAFNATPSIGPLSIITAAPPSLWQGLLYNDNGELDLVLGPAPGSALKGQGWARDASGRGYYLLAPQAIAYRHQGRTYTADGSLIVTTAATSVSDSIWQGVRTRSDGATYVKSVGAGYVLG